MRSNIRLILSVPDQHSSSHLLGIFSAFVLILQHKVFVIVVHIPELMGKLHNLVSGNESLGSLVITARPEGLPVVVRNICLQSCAPDYPHII